MLDGNVLLRQKRDEVPEGTLSCPDRNMEVFNQLRHYEGLRLLPSVCEQIIIQQTLINMFFMNTLVDSLRKKISDTLTPLINHDYVLLDLPYYDNIGDTLIWDGTKEFLKTLPYKCLYYASKDSFRYRDLPQDTVILLSGGAILAIYIANTQSFVG